MLEENNIRINSLSSCLFIYKELLHKYKSKQKAIKHYKGIENKSNSYLVDKVILLEYKLKQKNKRLALKEYKGITSKSNLYLIDKVIETEKGLK